jgi:hypothetical protein
MVRVLGSGPSQDSALVRDRQPDQLSPCLAYNSSGGGVAVWTDFRNGLLDPDIYGQLLDASGQPRSGSANFRVNSDAGVVWQDHPKVAVDSLGAFTVVWEDARSGSFLVYARHFNAAGTPTGSEVAVAPLAAGDPRDAFQEFRPALAMTPSGAAMVVWEDNRRLAATNPPSQVVDIMMVPLDASGNPVGAAVRGSAGGSSTVDPTLEPSVAVDPQGNGFLFYSTTVTQVHASGTIINKDVDGRFFLAPARLATMLDQEGRVIASQAFSVADTLVSGFLFAQSRSSAGYLGRQTFAVAFQDERLGTGSREDIRARLYRVQALAGDTVRVYSDGPSFMVNDDTVPLPPDAAGIVYMLSASQYAPAVATDPAGSVFTVTWCDRRTGTNYNIMRQSYHVLPSDTLSAASGLRYLGRNVFVNSDIEIQDAVHGAAFPAYSGPGQLVVTWQADRIKSHGYDIYGRMVEQAPDTCVNADCRLAARIPLQAELNGQAVRLTWEVPAALSGGSLQLLRYDLEAYRTQTSARPVVLGSYLADAGSHQAEDRVEGPGEGYLYELMRDGMVVATAIPVPAQVRFAMSLAPVTPNPARGMARIAFTVPGRSSERVPVKLRVYDVAGRCVRTLAQEAQVAGPRAVNWSGDVDGGARAGTGVYFLRLDAGGQVASRKMLWMR